jgi:hypothetical protein
LNLQVIRKPQRGDGAVSVVDPTGKRLKIPVWMLLPDSAQIKIAERAHLSREALLSLTSLLVPTQLNSKNSVHDSLTQAIVDKCKGGHRATSISGNDDPKRGGPRATQRNGTNRIGRAHGAHVGGGFSNGRREDK